ncbi:MAG TPA: 50S ribosomal protein L3 [Thermoanaerobaculia bacterium]|nr:50S ribosomal protein L3 [Thermoanaerobaculia bacterium]
MKGLIGKKMGMTRVFDEDGRSIPVTVLECGPCPITQIKTNEKDGYQALQLGFGADRKEKRTPKPLLGHLAKSGSGPQRMLREFRVSDLEGYALGQKLTVELFDGIAKVRVTGISKGRGFAGVIRRYNFQRGRETHGSHNHRVPGSIGACATPSRVFRGKKMPGRMGNDRVSVKNLEVVRIDKENNLLFVKGAVPGTRNGFILVDAVSA